MQSQSWRNRVWSCVMVSLVAALPAVLTKAAQADPLAYEVSTFPATGSPNLFGVVDLATGGFAQTSEFSFTPAGLAVVGHSLYTGVFIGTGFDQVDPLTGTTTQISNSGLNGGNYLALGSTLNVIYALDDSFNLYTVDPMTGAATLLGSTGLSAANAAYQLSTGSSVLYFGLANELYTLNTLTGAATDIGPTSLTGNGLDGLVSERGVLYSAYSPSITASSEIYTLDSTSGAATFVAEQDAAVGVAYGLAPMAVPEPGAYVMFGIAFAALGIFRPPLAQRLAMTRPC